MNDKKPPSLPHQTVKTSGRELHSNLEWPKQILILQMYCNARINISFVQHQCELITICVALSTLYRHGQTMHLRILVNCSLVYLLDLYRIIRSLVNGSIINQKAPHEPVNIQTHHLNTSIHDLLEQ